MSRIDLSSDDDEFDALPGEDLTDEEMIDELRSYIDDLEGALVFATWIACFATGLDPSFFTMLNPEEDTLQ